MYNIVVFCGGTGSIALQEGFSSIYGNENYNIDIVINAYDNGKSTGACRKVFNNRILGPSDLRKNHMVQFRTQHKKRIKDYTSREAVLCRLFDKRFDATDKEDCYKKACKILENETIRLPVEDKTYLKDLINYFFFTPIKDIPGTIVNIDSNNIDDMWRTTLDGIDFNDFSIANIFYASEAAINDNSMRIAGNRMAEFLHIKDNVHLISDVNLFLAARTKSGELITDEGDIVQWDNPENRITSVLLMKDGEEYIPSIDEETDVTRVRSVKDIMSEADIIIFSSGTQWSSLIPSYMHAGFRKVLSESKAKKYIVINNAEDYDMKGVKADEILGLIGNYIPLGDLTAIVNEDAVQGMNYVTKVRSISGHIGGEGKKHNPIKLVKLLMRDFFNLDGEERTFIYDLDGTLWDERANNYGKSVGTENINLFRGVIHSGNNYEHVRDVFKYLYHQDEVVQIYSDFGNVHFTSEDYSKEVLCENYLVDPDVVNTLEAVDEFKDKIKIRGEGSVVTIKPLMNRAVLLEKAKKCLESYKGLYVAYISGHTSIDIMHKDYSKATMLPLILEDQGLKKDEVVFVGNELDYGAETGIKQMEIKTIQTNDVYECNMLLRTIRSI